MCGDCTWPMEKKSHWISVEDELPAMGTPVLIYLTYPEGRAFNTRAYAITRNNYIIGGLNWRKEWVSNMPLCEPIDHVSHWMAIPKAPNE